MSKIVFITGIDTDSGKTFATGLLSRTLLRQGKTVITQKLIQTGSTAMSSDIAMHRKLMQIDLCNDDFAGVTCPYIFKFAGSPFLASSLEHKRIALETIDECTSILAAKYNYVLIEGVGGLQVPLAHGQNVIDFIKDRNYPVILVSSGKLGSINHTALSIEACVSRNIEIIGVVYNLFPQTDEIIMNDSRQHIQALTSKYYPNAFFVDMPFLEKTKAVEFFFDIII